MSTPLPQIHSSTQAPFHQIRPQSKWKTVSQEDYYVYKLVKPDVSSPQGRHTVQGETARSNHRRGHDDTLAEWSGWYRLYLQGKSAQISEWCVSYTTCGGYTQLWLNGSHPQPEDGIVTRDVYGTNVNYYTYNYYDYYYYYYFYYNNYHSQCSNRYRSRPIQVKACPGHYYVYKLVKPELSIPMPTYCTVAFDSVLTPCYNYVSLDQPWRAY
ncbi:hypothetical protein NFI96_032775 [Prochilodus magdalenae]|nr:hypothetical protein NFI96_032775 [Prochilodus magdalenae]